MKFHDSSLDTKADKDPYPLASLKDFSADDHDIINVTMSILKDILHLITVKLFETYSKKIQFELAEGALLAFYRNVQRSELSNDAKNGFVKNRVSTHQLSKLSLAMMLMTKLNQFTTNSPLSKRSIKPRYAILKRYRQSHSRSRHPYPYPTTQS